MSLLTLLDSESGATGGSPPVFSVSDPDGTSPIGRYQEICFEVTTTTTSQESIIIKRPDGCVETAYFNGAFQKDYSSGSTRTAISGGFRYCISRLGGWTFNPTICAMSCNEGGFAYSEYAFTLEVVTAAGSGPGDVAPGTDYPLAEVTNHAEYGKGELLKQMQLPRMQAYLCAILDEVQEVETALFGIFAQLDPDNAGGVWLDRIGVLVDEERRSRSDADYLQAIKVKAAVLQSSGTHTEISTVAKTLAPLANVQCSEPGRATLYLGIFQTWTEPEAIETMALLARMKSAAVQFHGIYSLSPYNQVFRTASGAVEESDPNKGFGNLAGTTGGKLAGDYAV